MKAFWQIVALEFTAAVRSRLLLILSVLSAVWMLVLPYLVSGDGTPDGAHQVYVRYSLGIVFALLSVCLGAAAAGSIARDRAAKRLQLTTVRPVRYFTVALGRTVALTAVGAIVMSVVTGLALVRTDPWRTCYHLLSPVMESPREEAEKMYDVFMADPETPPEVKKAKRDVVIRLLTQKAVDHYQTIETNETAVWTFPDVPSETAGSLAVRLRFSTLFDKREDVKGVFSIGNCETVISNLTQTVLTVPFELDGDSSFEGPLVFRNDGTSALMLRPRKDINLLYGSGFSCFAINLALASLELVCILSAVIAFAMCLSAGLGRSVAVFTVLAALFVTTVSPTVVEQYPDQLETDRKDRIGLAIARAVRQVSSPVSSYAPIEALAEDVCVELSEVGRCLAFDLVLLPLLLSLVSGLVIPRKQQD